MSEEETMHIGHDKGEAVSITGQRLFLATLEDKDYLYAQSTFPDVVLSLTDKTPLHKADGHIFNLREVKIVPLDHDSAQLATIAKAVGELDGIYLGLDGRRWGYTDNTGVAVLRAEVLQVIEAQR